MKTIYFNINMLSVSDSDGCEELAVRTLHIRDYETLDY